MAVEQGNIRLFQFLGEPGPHPVGLRVEHIYDRTRVFRPLTDAEGRAFAGDRARPLQVLTWYPAEEAAREKPAMTVADYASLWATEISFDAPRTGTEQREWLDALAPTLGHALWARRDAEALSGPFPLLVYAPSFSSTAWENADLCEYLASHGYVVMASPNMGATTRAMTADVPGINAQAQDIAFLIGHAASVPAADLERLAVAGFSWGGISNLFAAARDNRVKALVAFDGSLRYWPGLIELAGDVDPRQMTVPLLYFAKGDWTLEERAEVLTSPSNQGASVLNDWRSGDCFIARMLGMTHRQFSSFFQRNEDFWTEFADPRFVDCRRGDYERGDGIEAYRWVCRYTLAFLDAYLKAEVAADAFLKRAPRDNGVPPHLLALEHCPASTLPGSFDTLRAELGRRGFDQALPLYREVLEEHAGFSLAEVLLADWLEALLDGERLDQALFVADLLVEVHGGSATAWTAAGRARMIAGHAAQAREAFQKAIALSPRAAEARRRLSELDARAYP
jgi:tetratricopeptide (TPR) repeat protein